VQKQVVGRLAALTRSLQQRCQRTFRFALADVLPERGGAQRNFKTSLLSIVNRWLSHHAPPARLCPLTERGAQPHIKRLTAHRGVLIHRSSELTRISRRESETTKCRCKITSVTPLLARLLRAVARCVARDSVSELHDDTSGKATTNSRGGCEQFLVTIHQRTAQPLSTVCVEKGKRNLWANPTHIEQRCKQALLIAACKPNQRLLVLPHDVMQVELHGGTFAKCGEETRKNADAET
jgi:hypothetical protein